MQKAECTIKSKNPISVAKQHTALAKRIWRPLTAGCLASLHVSTTILTGILLLGTTPERGWAVTSNQERGEPDRRSQGMQNSHSIAAVPSSIPNSIAQTQIQVVPFELQNTPPQRFEQNPQFRPYRLGPGDAIGVSVPRFPELSGTFAIDPEGNVALPLLGKVPIAGFTLEEAQERIRLGYNRFVVNPEVTVSLSTPRPAQVTITGEVVRPGLYPLGTLPRLIAALQVAGNTTPQADLRTILVRRFLNDGSYLEQRVDLFTPLIAGDPIPDFFLQDGDAIIVPKLEVGNVSTYDTQLVARSNLAQPTIAIRVFSYPGNRIGNLVLPNGSNFIDAVTAISPDLQNSDIGNIALIRFDPERGRAVVRELNARKALFGDASQNVPLRNNDVIVVGRTLIARITYALNIFTQPFRDILGFLLFFRSLSQSATDLFNPESSDDN